jgi:hypothetical protein
VSKIKHSAKNFFVECFLLPRVFCLALDKELLCRVLEKKHSAKHLALGKEPNSGSDNCFLEKMPPIFKYVFYNLWRQYKEIIVVTRENK